MSLYNTFVYNSGLTYGTTEEITAVSATVINANTIELTFSGDVVRNVGYLNPANYAISVFEGTGSPIQVIKVLNPNSLTNDKVYLLTNYHTPGTTYLVAVSGLSGRAGQTVAGTFKFTSRVTKLDQMLKSVPTHFSRDPDSLILNLLTAIAKVDDRIGGSLDESP